MRIRRALPKAKRGPKAGASQAREIEQWNDIYRTLFGHDVELPSCCQYSALERRIAADTAKFTKTTTLPAASTRNVKMNTDQGFFRPCVASFQNRNGRRCCYTTLIASS